MTERHYDVVLLGGYTKDTIISPAGTRQVDGGGFNYGTNVVARMGLKTAAITRLAREDFHLVAALRELGVDVFATATPQSTCLTLEYPTADVDRRMLRVTATSGSFEPREAEGITAGAFVIGPSIRGEVPLAVIDEIKRRNSFISLDVQGYVRVVRADGVLADAPWPEKEAVLSRVDVVKTDAVEAEFLTGETDIRRAAESLAALGPREIVLTHRDGLLVYDGKDYHAAGFYPERLVGRSGRGDTVIASYMAKRLSAPPAEAAVWAAAVTSLKMEAEGPFRREIAEVEALIAGKYRGRS